MRRVRKKDVIEPTRGDLFKVPLSAGKHSYGQVAGGVIIGLLDWCGDRELSSDEILRQPIWKVEMGDYAVCTGRWPIVGHGPPHPELRGPFSFWRWHSPSQILISTFEPGVGYDSRFGSEEEIEGMRPDGLARFDDVEDSLCEHFGLEIPDRGRPRAVSEVPGSGLFENDQAGDWLDSTSQGKIEEEVARAIDAVLALEGSYIDADEGREAVAAAAVLAMKVTRYRPGGHFPESAGHIYFSWGRVKEKAKLIDAALRALALVRGEQSELAALWDPSGTGKSPWHDEVARLEAALLRAKRSKKA